MVADYSGPPNLTGCYRIEHLSLSVKPYMLMPEHVAGIRPKINQLNEGEAMQTRTLVLPNVVLEGEWESLVFDGALPSQLLHELTRVLEIMKQPGLNLKTFNWNRICLLHGPPGTGKSTLCRALAQKLSIRLNDSFSQTILFEIDCNTMLSKYFGESGKRISCLFDDIITAGRSSTTLVCVVIDEIETVATSREKSTKGGECREGFKVRFLSPTSEILELITLYRQQTSYLPDWIGFDSCQI